MLRANKKLQFLYLFLISLIPGNCRKDKVEYAIHDISGQIMSIDGFIGVFRNCRTSLRNRIEKSYDAFMKSLLYGKVDQCTLAIGCKLPDWRKQLMDKKKLLEKEHRILIGGWKELMKDKGKLEQIFFQVDLQ